MPAHGSGLLYWSKRLGCLVKCYLSIGRQCGSVHLRYVLGSPLRRSSLCARAHQQGLRLFTYNLVQLWSMLPMQFPQG